MSTEPRIIDAKTRWGLVDLRDLWYYRDLLYFLVWRDIKVRYAQSVLGVGWAVIQPVFLMIVFTLVFGRLARLDSDGAPYAIFSYVALVPWTYFSNALTDSTTSLVQNSALITKDALEKFNSKRLEMNRLINRDNTHFMKIRFSCTFT